MTSVTLNEAREAVYARWAANVPAAIGANYGLDNEKLQPPKDAVWARLTMVQDPGEQDSLGADGCRKFLRRARVLVQIHDGVNNGMRTLDQLSSAVRNIFEGTRFAGLYFTNVDVRETGPDGEWYQVVVDAPFFFEETK